MKWRSLRGIIVISAAIQGSAVFAATIPAADIVHADEKEWAQVDLFTGISWSDANAICTNGTCAAGTLNGYDMAGWEWASIDDLNSLFNFYIGSAELGPGPDSHTEIDSLFGFAYDFQRTWRTTTSVVFGGSAYSDSAGLASNSADSVGAIALGISTGSRTSIADTSGHPEDYPNRGAWFYRAPEVPVPAAAWLFGSALLGLGVIKHKRA